MVFFLDFSKAVDTVSHEILLKTLQSYGVRGLPLKWFISYLRNRKQYTALGNTKSPMQTMTCAIPQGSTLGILLFLIYVNDLPKCSDKLSFKIFADDTNVFASGSNLKALEALMNSELEKVKEWRYVNKLSINMTKTNFMIITSTRKKDMPVNIQIRNSDGKSHSLVRKNHIKLGVMIDDYVS